MVRNTQDQANSLYVPSNNSTQTTDHGNIEPEVDLMHVSKSELQDLKAENIQSRVGSRSSMQRNNITDATESIVSDIWSSPFYNEADEIMNISEETEGSSSQEGGASNAIVDNRDTDVVGGLDGWKYSSPFQIDVDEINQSELGYTATAKRTRSFYED
ncbi:hypothetical protein FGB62_57g212 [Gracilaria domingensis]|nr:hypothetical protein FGB62_57g212 [Gracilaria domingensis]